MTADGGDRADRHGPATWAPRDHGPEILLVAWAFAMSASLYYPAAAAGIAAGAWLSSGIRWRTEIPRLAVAPALGAFLSLLGTGSLGPAVHAAAMLGGAACWSAVGAASPRRPGEGVVSLGAFLVLAVAALADGVARGSSPVLWMASPIDLGMIVLILALQGLACVPRERARWVVLALAALVLVATTSRGLLIALGVALLVLFPRRRGAVLGFLVATAVIALPLVSARLASDPLAWGRARIWAGAVELSLLRPWAGWGLGDFANASRLDLMADPLPARHFRQPVYAHNDALQLAVEIGWPLALWTLAGLVVLVRARRMEAPRESLAVLAALAMLSLVYFPFQLAWPLAAAAWHLGRLLPEPAAMAGAPGTRRVVARTVLRLGALAAVLYAFGLATGDASLARWDPRIAIASQDAAGVYRMAELEPRRPEAHANVAMLAASHGSRGGAVRGFEAAVARAPAEMPLRLEASRAWLWYAADPSLAPEVRARAVAVAGMHLGWIRATEPLALAGAASRGDSLALVAAQVGLARAARSGEPARHLEALSRTVVRD